MMCARNGSYRKDSDYIGTFEGNHMTEHHGALTVPASFRTYQSS